MYVFIHVYTNYIKAEHLEIENELQYIQFLNFVLLSCVESLKVVLHLCILGYYVFFNFFKIRNKNYFNIYTSIISSAILLHHDFLFFTIS